MRRNPEAVEPPPARRITTTRQARRARREARLILLSRHDWTVCILRNRLADTTNIIEVAEAINYHMDRMEHHLDMIEAGR